MLPGFVTPEKPMRMIFMDTELWVKFLIVDVIMLIVDIILPV